MCREPHEVVDHVDAVLVLSEAPSGHLEHARAALEAGRTTYIDKPLAADLDTATAIYDLAEQHQAPLFSGSGMRFCPDVAPLARTAHERLGELISIHVQCPVTIDLFVIHGIEIANLFFGHDADRVEVITGPRREVALITYTSGTTAVIDHVNIEGDPRYLGTLHGTRASLPFNAGDIGRNMLAISSGIEEYLVTRRPPAGRNEVIGLLAISLAARRAKETGSPIKP